MESDADGTIGSVVSIETSRKSKEMGDLGGESRDVSASAGNAPRRTRTYNPLIKSQLLCQLS